ncbi:MAG: DUF2510 domain-containing protein [Microthrixaceae bacterium]|nr:DUF2510 domain-containing protein [Microthrixaceae bacterium]
MTNPPTEPSAGWYPDPAATASGTLRWWNGTSWSTEVRAAKPVAAPPLSPPPPEPAARGHRRAVHPAGAVRSAPAHRPRGAGVRCARRLPRGHAVRCAELRRRPGGVSRIARVRRDHRLRRIPCRCIHHGGRRRGTRIPGLRVRRPACRPG